MTASNLKNLPIYNEGKPEQSGLYLGLFHGRNDPNQDMNDWGFNGQIIGPLNYVHTTYQSHIKLDFVNPSDIRRYDLNTNFTVLELEDGMVKFANAWYDDWTVFYYTESQPLKPSNVILPNNQESICVLKSVN